MDNEMMNKVNDVLKAKGMRELSMDEMGKVSGGTDVLVNGTVWSEGEVYDLAMAMVDSFGYDVAAATFCTMTGLDQYEIKRTHKGGCSDKENMQLLVYRCMQIYDNIADHGHSY